MDNEQQPSPFIRPLDRRHVSILPENFAGTPWQRSSRVFEDMLEGQERGAQLVYVAEGPEGLLGYGTLLRESQHVPFREAGIPEIYDVVVHPDWRRKGVGTALMEKLEDSAAEFSDRVGIGVGLHSGYGPAQRLYVKRGYVPDGRGIFYKNVKVEEQQHIRVDDDLTLWLLKELEKRGRR